MGRPAKFSEDQILDAALAITVESGPGAATMAAIAARLGGPVGSLYHRFGSRDLLLATLWVRCVRRFQEGFVAAVTAGDVEAAALHTPAWCRRHPAEAAVLLLYRREELAAGWPAELGAGLGDLNARASAELKALATARGLGYERLVFALVDVPYGAVRRYLTRREPPPPSVDELITATCRAVLS
ncbi:TetR/AcrR family transcriptional regulator [Actinomadura sp. HBU206391]|uniref:TetR/AcrR family transcriptional regulator n=1 Tax=Actinomadura sp. HBU206391 TaxID=2731692 RepID=UPI00164FF95E|nr:TetR/AcrR family transcriptional regulator [Actinomadura sp. HBU206391]MBC6463574.1 TetR/AcrR family transcriptional regulator [Actinomadura sp. HBU206391]